MRRLLLLLPLLALLAAGAYWLAHRGGGTRRARPPVERGGDFTLHGATGPWTLSRDGQGFVTLLYFGFTHCPGFCPMTLASLRTELGRLAPNERSRMKVVFVSVDYRADTPASTEAYAKTFGPAFVGLTGSKEELDAVTARYGAAYEVKESAPGSGKFNVDHSNQVFVIGPRGNLVDWLTLGYQDAKLGATIRDELQKIAKTL